MYTDQNFIIFKSVIWSTQSRSLLKYNKTWWENEDIKISEVKNGPNFCPYYGEFVKRGSTILCIAIIILMYHGLF